MDMTGERTISASQDKVWSALNDPDVLKAAIPGCETLERTAENEFTATVTVKLGPIKAAFKGKVTLSDIEAPRGYRISGEGQGGVAGFAKGGATVALVPLEEGTLLTYSASAAVGGKIAQLGARLIDSTARKLTDQFFANFDAIVSRESVAGSEARAQ
jgi:carbon monoxide dehydrogenase subunit G